VSHAHSMRASFLASQYRGDVNGKWQVVSSKGESSGRGAPLCLCPLLQEPATWGKC
jgi:hypothetical protein